MRAPACSTMSVPSFPCLLLGVLLVACGDDAATAPKALPVFTRVSAGIGHTCGLTADGTAYCWGSNTSGNLGGGDGSSDGHLVRVRGGLHFTSLSAGALHTCGVTASGATYCWGLNQQSQLGDGTVTADRSTPVRVVSANFVAVTAGASHTCGLMANGEAYCWGGNDYGQLGDGTRESRQSPRAVTGGHRFTSLEASHFHSCGITTAGPTYCWGAGDRGRLGDGTGVATVRSSPIRVAGDVTFTALAATHGAGGCGLSAGGVAWCWGWNSDGELGDGTRTDRWVPVPVAGGLVFRELGGGGEGFTCGLTTAGLAYCWGDNQFQQLGDGTSIDRLTPVPLPVDRSFTSLALGAAHGCAADGRAALHCWGQLGAPTLEP